MFGAEDTPLLLESRATQDDCLIGMGAILLNGVTVGSGSIVAAGALCPEGMSVPPNSLAIGVPARVIRPTTDDERGRIRTTVAGPSSPGSVSSAVSPS